MAIGQSDITKILTDLMGSRDGLSKVELEEWAAGEEYGGLLIQYHRLNDMDEVFARLYLTGGVRGYVEGLQQPRTVRA